MSTQTGSISFEATGGFNSYAKQNYATLSQIKGQFATCSTGAAVAAKVATIVPADSGWTLYEGATVTVKFITKNTTTAPTLNVNGTGAKPIKDYAGHDLTKAAYEWPEGAAMALTYDGSSWRIQDSNLMERVHTAETGIEQNSKDIKLKANTNDVYNKEDVNGLIAQEVTDRDAAIELSATGIKQTVSETYATKNEAKQTDSASGLREIVTEDAAELPLLGLTVYGESVQDSTTGKNLLEPTNVALYRGGNGTLVSDSNDVVSYVARVSRNTDYVVTYNGGNRSNVVGTGSVVPAAGIAGTYVRNTQTRVSPFTFNSGENDYVLVQLGYNSDAPVSEQQLEAGSTATSYEPYMGGKPSPSPDYPQEVKAVRGRNIIPFPYRNMSAVSNGITYTANDDGTVIANGTATANSFIILHNADTFGSYPQGTYTLSGSPNIAGCSIRLQSDDGSGGMALQTSSQGAPMTFTTSGELKIASGNNNFFILVASGTVLDNAVFKPMLNVGTVASPYIPYGCIAALARGKNLIQHSYAGKTSYGVTLVPNSDGSISVNGTATGNVIERIAEHVMLRAGTYTLSGCPLGGSNNTYRLDVRPQAGGVIAEEYGDGATFTLSSDTEVMYIIRVQNGTTVQNLMFFPQLELGTTATDYEPYRESVSYIDLKGNGAYYLDDEYQDTAELDASGHVLLHKRCGRKTIAERDGSGRYAAGVYWVKFSDMLGQDVTSGTAHDNTHPLLSTSFVHTTGSATVWTSGSLVGYFTRHTVAAYPSYNHEVFFRIADDLSNTEFAEQYADVEIVYPLDEPYTIDLGYIDMPTTFDGGSVRIDAEIQPVIDASWWTKAGYDAGKAFNEGNTSADLTALTERVTTAESSITQQAGQIEAKVSKTDYTGATVTSLINQSADSVKIQANHVEIDGTATFKNSDNTTTTLGNYLTNNYDAKGAAQTAVDNLEIGGRNLLKTPIKTFDNDAYLFAQLNLAEKLVANETYTLQLWGLTVDSASSGIGVYWGGGSNSFPNLGVGGSSVKKPDANGYLSYTFTVTETNANHAQAANLWLNLYNGPNKRTSPDAYAATLDRWKLEKGNTATDWTPAPEDQTAYVDESIDNIDIGGRNLLVANAGKPGKWTVNAPSDSSFVKSESDDGYYVNIAFNSVSGYENLNAPAITVKVGQEYTLSCAYTVGKEYNETSGKGGYGLSVRTDSGVHGSYDTSSNCIGKVRFEKAVGSYRSSFTFTATVGTIYLCLNGGQIADNQTGLSFDLYDVKLEKGNKATDWTPAPEDVDAAIEQSVAGQGGFTILWNYEKFATANNGEGYICALNPTTGTKSDADGWVMWNGVKRTIPKGMINPNAAHPYNTPCYVVCRLSSATATTGTNYIVSYGNGWKGGTINAGALSAWTWNEATDIIIGKYVEPASEAAFVEMEIYNPPLSSKQITTQNITAARANSTANAAAPKSSAIARTQRIYYRTNTALSSSITGPTTWITDSDNKYNTTAPTTATTGWSTKPTPLAASTAADATKYLYLYTCIQTQTVEQAANNGTTCTASTILLDDTTTVIDGGKIITGSIDANAINANTISGSSLTISSFSDSDNYLNSNIQVGGRNLILKTGTPASKTMPAVAAGKYTTWDPYTMVDAYNTLGLTTDDYLTISFDWSVTGAAANSTIKIGTNVDPWEYFGVVATFAEGSSSGHVEKSFKCTAKLAASTGHIFRARIDAVGNAITTSMVLTISNVKLERGNHATDWTPAPEDTDNTISDAAKTATNYVTNVTGGGIMVHPNGDSTSGWKIADTIELLKNDVSYIKAWLDNSTAKVRVGLENSGHSVFSPNGMEVFTDSTTSVASFGAGWARIGNGSQPHVEITPLGMSVTGVGANAKPRFSISANDMYSADPFSPSGGISTGMVTSLSSGFAKITPAAMSIGNPARANEDGATFVATMSQVRIGKASTSNQLLDYHSMQFVDKEGTTFFHVSDLRGENGVARIVETFVGNGDLKGFLPLDTLFQNPSITVSDSSGGSVTYPRYPYGSAANSRYILFETAPTDGSIITFEYDTQSQKAKAYTLGTAMQGGSIGVMSMREGLDVESAGIASHAEGRESRALREYSHAEGYQSVASADAAHAEGNSTASGRFSHAEGVSEARGDASHAEGFSLADNGSAHAEGEGTSALSHASHSEGLETVAGDGTTVSIAPHAEGYQTIATGKGAHSEGIITNAIASASHAQNYATIAASDNQTALGKYNIKDTNGDYAVIVGNGTADNTRSNALTIEWDGTVETAGSAIAKDSAITMNNTPTDANVTSQGFYVEDSNDVWLSRVVARNYTSGRQGTLIEAHRTVNGTDKYNTLNIGVEANGNSYVSVSDAAAWRTGIGAMGVKNANGYDGLAHADGTDTGYIRTTQTGLIPYQNGGSGTLGTSNWPFNTMYTKVMHIGDVTVGADPTTTSTVANIITAASGYTINNANVAVWGKVCTFHVTLTTTAAIATGNISNLTVGTLKAAYRPKISAAVSTTGTGPVAVGYIGTNGNLYIASMGGALAANGQLSLGGTYVLA